uniref:Fatty acid desaturase n=1 Tax=Hirondellea gigas TaxID=1518452 RepID=A0A6A7G7P1_9CRUS
MTNSQDETNEVPSPVNFLSPLSHQEISELTSRSDASGLAQTLFHGSFIGAASWAVSVTTGWLHVCSFLFLAFVVSFLFCPLHECVHQTAFKSRLLNQILASVTGFLTLRPSNHYWYYHWAHHKHTGNSEKDPELQNTMLDPDISTFSGYLIYLSSIPFWIDRIWTTFRHSFGKINDSEFYLQSDFSQLKVIREAKLYLFGYLFVGFCSYYFAFSSFLLTYWIFPSLIGQIHLRFYLLAEHKGCNFGSDIFGNTRTTMTLWLYRRLAWNMPLHAEHHAWPAVSFHCLPIVHSIVNSKLEKGTMKYCNPSGEFGYLSIHQTFLKRMMFHSKKVN